MTSPHLERFIGRQILPLDDPQRTMLHNEVHMRPNATISVPALVVFVAVCNQHVTREDECEHLRTLPNQNDLALNQLKNNFLRVNCDNFTVKWERHSEFTRYSIVQELPEQVKSLAADFELSAVLKIAPNWLKNIPGETIAAIELVFLNGDIDPTGTTLESAKRWFPQGDIVASQMGSSGHSWAITDFNLRSNGFERMLVITPPSSYDSRAGRIAQRLLEIETYRLMALKGLPVAKDLAPMLYEAEMQLANITSQLENKSSSDQELLDTLIALATKVERATAHHGFRFSATRAYDSLVRQRILELREKAIPGNQTLGEFMQRRLSPAISTVAATEQRLGALSQRIERTSALLRTRVDIITETQNQQLLEKLTQGQTLQLRLQSTVEGLSIAAISYYVISLLLYFFKALKASGMPINLEISVGIAVPIVIFFIWRLSQHIHSKINVA